MTDSGSSGSSNDISNSSGSSSDSVAVISICSLSRNLVVVKVGTCVVVVILVTAIVKVGGDSGSVVW